MVPPVNIGPQSVHEFGSFAGPHNDLLKLQLQVLIRTIPQTNATKSETGIINAIGVLLSLLR